MKKIGNITISNEFDKNPVPDSLIQYVDRVGYMYALTGVINFLSRSNPWYEVEIDWTHSDENRGLCYVIHLWYGCDNFSINETVEVYRENGNYITITDDEDYNNSAIID